MPGADPGQRHDKAPSISRGATPRGGLVMICDVDLEMPDATRTHTVEVARCFAAEGFDVDLVTRGSDPCLTGVRHHRARGSETGRGRVRRITDLSLRSLLILCTRRRSADKCYVRQKWSNVAIVLAARLLGYHVVTQVDDLPYERDHKLLIPFLGRRVKRLATILMSRLSHGIVAVTPEIKALLIDEFRTPAGRIATLPNGVDIDFFRPLPRAEAIARAGLDPDCRYAVFCGNFQPWVDFDTLLEAFSIVASRLTDARLILVGDGPERELVDGEIRRLGIGDSVLKTGFVRDRAAVRDLIAASTVTLSANRSSYRARIGVSPVKMAEYLACGRTVVTTDLSGLRESIEETDVGAVTPADPRAFSEAMIALLDPKRADELGANARRLAEERYAWRSIVQRTVPLFGI